MSTIVLDIGGDGTDGTGGIDAFPVKTVSAFAGPLDVDSNLTFFVVNNIAPLIIPIPENAEEAFPIGAEMEFLRERGGTATVTFAVIGVAVLQSRDALFSINAQYSAVTLKKIDTNEWRLIGDLA